MPAGRSGALRPAGKPVGDAALPPAMAACPEPGADAIARHRKGHKDRFAPVLRNTVPARADPLDRKLDDLRAVRLRATETHLSEVGLRQRPGRGTDRHGRRGLAVDHGPAPFEQRQGGAGEVDDAVD